MSVPKLCHAVHARSGCYLQVPESLEELGAALLYEWDEGRRKRPILRDSFVPVDDFDSEDLASAGWGVVFAAGIDPAVREALAPLLRKREQEANANGSQRYCELADDKAPRLNETAEDFLARAGVNANGSADPTRLPYYLLLVGGPSQISFELQTGLDVAHAVGRLSCDSVDEYAAYAASVLAAEGKTPSRRLVAFGPRNGEEPTGNTMIERWFTPVLDRLERHHPEWRIERILGAEASRSRFEGVLSAAPSLLFTAGHGMCLDNDDADQRKEQGALVCSEWPGEGPVMPGSYFAANDVVREHDLRGTIAFQFACFSAATPSCNEFEGLVPGDRWVAPDPPFVSALPKRFLSQPDGRGALAVVGHVDRIWRSSFLNEKTDQGEALVFHQFLGRLLSGGRLGRAIEPLNRWYANCAVTLSSLQLRHRRGLEVNPADLARTWLVHNDAKNYIVLGDPAVRCAR